MIFFVFGCIVFPSLGFYACLASWLAFHGLIYNSRNFIWSNTPIEEEEGGKDIYNNRNFIWSNILSKDKHSSKSIYNSRNFIWSNTMPTTWQEEVYIYNSRNFIWSNTLVNDQPNQYGSTIVEILYGLTPKFLLSFLSFESTIVEILYGLTPYAGKSIDY